MGGVSELLRFGIPGWLLIIFVAGFVVVRLALEVLFLQQVTLSISEVEDIVTAVSAGLTVFVTVFGAAAGLPIGYILYQVYWWVTEHGAPYVRLIPVDRGAAVLQDVDVPFEELVQRRYKGPVPAKYGPARIPGFWHWMAQSHLSPAEVVLWLQDNKSLANFVWNFLLQKTKAEMVRQKAQQLTDTYHSLGAARVAICSAFVVYLLIEGITQVWGAQHRLAVAVNLLILTVFFHILSTAREDTMISLVLFQHDFITFYWPRTDLVTPTESD